MLAGLGAELLFGGVGLAQEGQKLGGVRLLPDHHLGRGGGDTEAESSGASPCPLEPVQQRAERHGGISGLPWSIPSMHGLTHAGPPLTIP